MINDRTRREYRRLLVKYALACFPPGERLRDVDKLRARAFVDWLCRLTDEDGHRLCDQSIRKAVFPLQSCLGHAARAGLLGSGPEPVMLLPRRRCGSAYEFDERRFLTREQLAALLAEVPNGWRPFFEVLASTGLRISEAIALRVTDVDLNIDQPRIRVRRAIVDGQLAGPKSRHGRRAIPISTALAAQLRPIAAGRAETDLLFVGAQGATLRPGNLRYRVMIPAAERACVTQATTTFLRYELEIGYQQPTGLERLGRLVLLRERGAVGALSHTAPHPRGALDRRRRKCTAVAALDAPPLRSVHAGHIRAPHAGRARPVAGAERGAHRRRSR